MTKEPRYYREDNALPVNSKYPPLTAAQIMAEAWISTEDRLPEVYTPVLVADPSKDALRGIYIGVLEGWGYWNLGIGNRRPTKDHALLWMELPPLPPQQEGQP